MNVTIESLKQQLTDAYKLCREGRTLELSTLPIAHTPLVEDCFLQDVPINPDLRGGTLQSVLRWATLRLRPGGQPSWIDYQWRLYNTVMHFYFERMRVAELAEHMAIAEQTLYQVRASAMEALARILLAELEAPQDLAGRKHIAISDRYSLYSADQQTILRLLAAFQQGMPTTLLHQLAEQHGIAEIQTNIHQIVATNWVVTNERGSELLLHRDVSQYLLTRLTPAERTGWHRQIGDYFAGREHYFQAAHHYFSAELAQEAALIFINHYNAIVNDLQVDEMLKVISELHPSDMDKATWARLKVVAGNGAHLLEDVDTALTEYQHALSAPDIDVKALAYYRRAKVLELRNTDEALAHYAYGIQLLEAQTPPNPLLIRIYIDRAILLLEERNDTTQAQADLQNAERNIAPDVRGDWSDLHSAWFRLEIQRENWDEAIVHGQQAWLAANELGDVLRLMRNAHNLGMTYARLGRFEEAGPYLERSHDLALELGNRQTAGASSKTIGGSLFMMGDYVGAEQRYLEAYAIFSELGNHNWQAHTCFDLAEVYAELGDTLSMHRYYDEGLRLATEAGDLSLVAAFEEFGRTYQTHFSDLSPRQIICINYVKNHGKITNKQYQEINEVSPRQALRDLQEMETLGLIVKAGKGRATHYRLPNS